MVVGNAFPLWLHGSSGAGKEARQSSRRACHFHAPTAAIADGTSTGDCCEMRFRIRPPGVVEGPIGSGTLYLPLACARARNLTGKPFKFTTTGPHMLAKTLLDKH